VTTLEALSLGASDYVTKPANVGSASAGMARVRDDLIPKIKSLSGRALNPQLQLPAAISAGRRPMPSNVAVRNRHVEIVAIGTSTGGPNALGEIVPEIPGDFPVPIVIVQHMPPIFTRLLADRLAAKSTIVVQECRAGDELRPAAAWIAPGDYHMTVDKSAARPRLDLNQGPPENSCRPSADVLFRSVARLYGQSALAVVLTGMGQDGFRGCEHIREAGGQIIAQDEASSVVWGMPGYVARAGMADQVLPIRQIAGEIVRRVMHSRISVSGMKQEQSKYGHVGR
jgi:two-component system chemotaxis response regulator CheB